MKAESPGRKTLVTGLSVAILFLLLFILSGCKSSPETQALETPDSVYMETGDRIIATTFDTLRNSLTRQIGVAGFAGAITFCKENASALIDTYADSVIIRRTALRYRNPENKPDSLELIILNSMSSEPGTKVPSSRVIRDHEQGEIHYFKPIMTQAMCLNCHGKPVTQIQPDVQLKITERYPLDQAVNFKEGNLRGAWHIIFKDK